MFSSLCFLMADSVVVAPSAPVVASLTRVFNVGVPVVAGKVATDTVFTMHWSVSSKATSDFAAFYRLYSHVRLVDAQFSLTISPTPGAITAVMAAICFADKSSGPKTIALAAAGGGQVVSAGGSASVSFNRVGFNDVLKGVAVDGEQPALHVILATGNSALEGSTVGYLYGSFTVEFSGATSSALFSSSLAFSA